jgi:pilus assembly protein Flp/PilA
MLLLLYAAAASRLTVLQARTDRGATAVEYGLLAALIAAVIVGIVFTLGGKINNAFSAVQNALP